MKNEKQKVEFIDPDTHEKVIVDIPLYTKRLHYEFKVTHNTWDEVESLGVTRHHEDPTIYFEYIWACNHNHAKSIYSSYNDIPYIEVRARKISKKSKLI